jgi:hypothetical protein
MSATEQPQQQPQKRAHPAEENGGGDEVVATKAQKVDNGEVGWEWLVKDWQNVKHFKLFKVVATENNDVNANTDKLKGLRESGQKAKIEILNYCYLQQRWLHRTRRRLQLKMKNNNSRRLTKATRKKAMQKVAQVMRKRSKTMDDDEG